MSRLVFDIEVVGADFDTLEEAVRQNLLKWTQTEEDEKKVRESTAFVPMASEVVAIAWMDPEQGGGAVYYQAPDKEPVLPLEQDGVRYHVASEKEILEAFWKAVSRAEQFVTYNGRGFDCPFIIARSAKYKIRPVRDLMPYRFNQKPHIDLMDQLTHYGAFRRFSLDMWCMFLGIKSPKGEISGAQVGDYFRAGKYEEIARYCVEDVRATAELLKYWEKWMTP